MAYPDVPSYKQFLASPKNSTERAIARYAQVLSDAHKISMPEMLIAKSFYHKNERKDNQSIIAHLIKGDFDVIIRLSDIRMWHRYDGGPVSIITFAHISPQRVQPFDTICLRIRTFSEK